MTIAEINRMGDEKGEMRDGQRGNKIFRLSAEELIKTIHEAWASQTLLSNQPLLPS